MGYLPLNYDKLNIISSSYQPTSVKAYNNIYFGYWVRSLFQRAQSQIILNVPWDGSERDFLYYCIFKFGYVGVFDKIEKYGLTFQPGTLKGYDWYYQPTGLLVSNPALKGKSLLLNIHKDCELIKLAPDYCGIFDIIERSAEKLASLDSALNMTIINSKLAYILGARNKGAAQALKKVMDKVNKGEPTVIFDQRILNDQTDKEQPFQNVDLPAIKNNYILGEQLKDLQTIINQFDAEIGIETVPYEKKERLVTAEAESKEVDAKARITVWIDTLNESFQLINKMFGTQMSATLRKTPLEGEVDNKEVPLNE